MVLARTLIVILWSIIIGSLAGRLYMGTSTPLLASFCIWLAASIMLAELVWTIRSDRK